MLYPLILAGGVGTRLWPMSRASLPKQFIDLLPGQGSLFQATLGRLQGLADCAAPTIVCNADHRFLVAEQLRLAGKEDARILLEPCGRNTAPAIAIAALAIRDVDPDATLLVLPADHLIAATDAFLEAVRIAYDISAANYLVTFGVVPDVPETGYGYIKRGDKISDCEGFRVDRFVEKPDADTAQSYLDAGDFYWNSGMFLFRADRYLEQLKIHSGDIHDCCVQAHRQISKGDDFQSIPEKEFAACRSDSIDYAVMEKTSAAAIVPLDAGWSDLGSWEALWQVQEQDESGNIIAGDVLVESVRDCYISSKTRLVAALGLKDTVIVESGDAVLVADKSRSQDVKKLADALAAQHRKEIEHPPLVRRPWGTFESLGAGDGYQVKHIVVNPGAAISLQRHQHRSEHWTVIRGQAFIHCDGNEFVLDINESTFIPQGSKHRLSNRGSEPVEIVEVQVGRYLGEDDIERFEDLYGR
jgi:mannose-1-phosphate guanylyltransferase/mannose-6-phosphate isomerase